jgi:hypothetical protein
MLGWLIEQFGAAIVYGGLGFIIGAHVPTPPWATWAWNYLVKGWAALKAKIASK